MKTVICIMVFFSSINICGAATQVGATNMFSDGANVGVGTSTPITALDIGTGTLTATQVNTGQSANGSVVAGSGFGMHLDVNGTTNALNINSSGNVGIGTIFGGSKITMGNQNANITNRIALYESDAAKDFYGVGMANPSGSIFGVGIYADSSTATPTNSNMRVMVEAVSGNVGVGTFFPQLTSGSVGKLVDIYGSTAGLALHNTTVPKEWMIYAGPSGSIRFFDATSGIDRFIMDTNGNVGIGTSTVPTAVVTIPTLKSSSGTRYLCIGTDGAVTSSASACVGT